MEQHNITLGMHCICGYGNMCNDYKGMEKVYSLNYLKLLTLMFRRDIIVKIELIINR